MVEGFAARALIALFAISVAVLLAGASHSVGKASTDKKSKDYEIGARWMAALLALQILLILCLGAA